MLRYLYSFLLYLFVPFILLRLLWRSRKTPSYRQRWFERFGFFNCPKHWQQGIWIHAVSVGETVAAIPLIRALQEKYPHLPITVTTMTVTGSERAKTLLGDSVFHVYVPYDLPCAVRRFLNRTRPKLLILMETELWPNMLYHTCKRKIPILLANARLSNRSAKGYASVKHFTNYMLRKLTAIAAQAKADADRFKELGMHQGKIQIVGSMKFDIKQPPSIKEAGELLRQQLGAHRAVWIAASTRDDEEKEVLKAFDLVKKEVPDCLLLLVPRHPERFDRVATMCRNQGLNIVLRSSGKHCSNDTDVYLGDSMGELMLFYVASDVAFVGGSLLPLGGQNVLEPASFGLPIITGPHLFNFAEAARLLKEKNAMTIVNNVSELAAQIILLLKDVELRHQMGERAQSVVEANRGALEQHLVIIDHLLKERL